MGCAAARGFPSRDAKFRVRATARPGAVGVPKRGHAACAREMLKTDSSGAREPEEMGRTGSMTQVAGRQISLLAGSPRGEEIAASLAVGHANQFIRHDAALTPIRILLWRSGALALWRYTTP